MKRKKEERQKGKWRSWETTEGVARAPHRSMMRAMGLNDDQYQKALECVDTSLDMRYDDDVKKTRDMIIKEQNQFK